jgi:16S rRNA (guanine(966)-N(2))-methyltransferase RsmD
MRIIAGSARGTTLKGPPDTGTRPTSDKVRGAIFNMLAAHTVGRSVLDLYAGTGAMGIEALSRGAAHCDFVERRHALSNIIKENLAKARLTEGSHVIIAEVPQVLSTLLGPYDLILADPPYADPGALTLVASPAIHRLLRPNAIVVLEHSPRVEVIGDTGPLRFVRTRRYGDCAVSLWQRDEKGGES